MSRFRKIRNLEFWNSDVGQIIAEYEQPTDEEVILDFVTNKPQFRIVLGFGTSITILYLPKPGPASHCWIQLSNDILHSVFQEVAISQLLQDFDPMFWFPKHHLKKSFEIEMKKLILRHRKQLDMRESLRKKQNWMLCGCFAVFGLFAFWIRAYPAIALQSIE